VIGVMPHEFYFLPARDIESGCPFLSRLDANELLVARRAGGGPAEPGVTLERAKESIGGIESADDGEGFRGPHSVIVTPLREELAGKHKRRWLLLLCASGGAPADRVASIWQIC